MIKKAWPWIGTTEHEMGSMSKSFQDTDQSPKNYDTLIPSKSLNPTQESDITYRETFVSPVENENVKPVSNSDDKKYKDIKNRESKSMPKENNQNIFKDILGDFLKTKSENKKYIKASFGKKSFICDIAQSIQDKINGLQTYPALDDDRGLLFPYDKPEDVVYHMGTVSYPIDIIFLDKNNKVKKVCSNISPGTLGTFGCSNVKYVLEVAGGQAKGLKENDLITLEPTKLEIKKSASLSSQNIELIDVYCFDELIEKNPYIYLDSVANYNEDNIKLGINNQVYTPGVGMEVKAAELNKFINKNYKFNISKTASTFKKFLENSEETLDIYNYLKKGMKDPNIMVIIATSLDSPKEVAEAFVSKLEILYGSFPKKNYKIEKISKEDNHINLIEKIRTTHPGVEIKLNTTDALVKKAGSPIPQSIKEQAKISLNHLNTAKDSLLKSIDNLKKNLSEYEKIRNEQEKITSTKGQYHQSVKRNVEVAKEYLAQIRDAIKILNKIKDATTTIEIIESLALSSQNCSSSLQEIFDLVNKMDTPDFVMLLTESTNNYISSTEDLKATIDRAKDYINTEILGIIVLSD